MRIGIGNDHVGYQLKASLAEHLVDLGHTVIDFGHDGTDRVDYPIYAQRVAQAVAEGAVECGVVMCGSGVGVSIVANKTAGVRCVCCSEPYSARLSRMHNDTNMIAMGSHVVGPGLARLILDSWLSAEFEGGRHASRVTQITAVEQGRQAH